jgi:hypothetical protein
MSNDLHKMMPTHVAILTQHLHNNIRPGSFVNYLVEDGDIFEVANDLRRAIDQPVHVIPYDDIITPDVDLINDIAGGDPAILVLPIRHDAHPEIVAFLLEALIDGRRLRARHTVIFVTSQTKDQPCGYISPQVASRMLNYSHTPDEGLE